MKEMAFEDYNVLFSVILGILLSPKYSLCKPHYVNLT